MDGGQEKLKSNSPVQFNASYKNAFIVVIFALHSGISKKQKENGEDKDQSRGF